MKKKKNSVFVRVRGKFVCGSMYGAPFFSVVRGESSLHSWERQAQRDDRSSAPQP